MLVFKFVVRWDFYKCLIPLIHEVFLFEYSHQMLNLGDREEYILLGTRQKLYVERNHLSQLAQESQNGLRPL